MGANMRCKKMKHNLERLEFDVLCGNRIESCVMWHDHIWDISFWVLDILYELRKKMCIQIGTWFIENHYLRLVSECSYEINTFPLTNRERYYCLWHKYVNFPIFQKFFQIYTIYLDSCEVLKEEYILEYRKCLKKWPIDQSISESSFSWEQSRIKYNLSRLWNHNASYEWEEGCLPYSRWTCNETNLSGYYIEREILKYKTSIITMTKILYTN